MKQFRILLLEDAFVTSVAIARALEFELPECVVMRAQSLYEARVLLKTYDFHFSVVDIQLPDGSGIDFLPEIAARAPGAGVSIITASPLPKYRQRASELGVLHFMEKPVDTPALARLIARHLRGETKHAVTSDTSFSASLRKLTALDVIQLKCLSRASVRLDFTKSEGTLGRIYLQDGEVVHAEVVPPSGTECKEGIEAFNETLSWRGGKVDEAFGAQAPRTTIQESWQSLVLNATKWADELPGPGDPPPT
jgi:DNA-binding NarL/FixJ family response regulator